MLLGLLDHIHEVPAHHLVSVPPLDLGSIQVQVRPPLVLKFSFIGPRARGDLILPGGLPLASDINDHVLGKGLAQILQAPDLQERSGPPPEQRGWLRLLLHHHDHLWDLFFDWWDKERKMRKMKKQKEEKSRNKK